MKKAEMELVPLDNADVIATSSPKDGMILSGLNDTIPNNLAISGNYNGNPLDFKSDSSKDNYSNFITYLQTNISGDISGYGDDIVFWLPGNTERRNFENLYGSDEEGGTWNNAFDGTYIWENGAFRMISSALQ